MANQKIDELVEKLTAALLRSVSVREEEMKRSSQKAKAFRERKQNGKKSA